MADNENAAPAAAACPICGKPRVMRYRPFCSSRCADIDMGRWLKGGYVIPGAPVEDLEEEEAPRRRERDEDDA